MLSAYSIVCYQFHAEFLRICPNAKDFVVTWEDMASAVIDWARLKTSFVAELFLQELIGFETQSLGISF